MVFASIHNLFDVGMALESLGFKRLNIITWFKTNAPPNITCRMLTQSSEFILWYAKDKNWTFNYDYTKNGDFSYDILKKAGKQMRDVWAIPNNKSKEETRFGKHPTQKPERIIERLIKMASNEGDLIVDLFNGSGTTTKIAKQFNRNFIGFEINQEYCEIANKRLQDIV